MSTAHYAASNGQISSYVPDHVVHSHRRTRLGDSLPRVLLAEDDEVACLLLERCLQGWGYQVVTVKNGTDAWEILRQDAPPELVILDWMMPGIDGNELCRRVRHGLSDFYHYVLLITGKSQKESAAQAWDEELVRPFASAPQPPDGAMTALAFSLFCKIDPRRAEATARLSKGRTIGSLNNS